MVQQLLNARIDRLAALLRFIDRDRQMVEHARARIREEEPNPLLHVRIGGIFHDVVRLEPRTQVRPHARRYTRLAQEFLDAALRLDRNRRERPHDRLKLRRLHALLGIRERSDERVLHAESLGFVEQLVNLWGCM